MNRKIDINYNWYFKEIYKKGDLKLGFFDGFELVNLPHSNKEVPLNNFSEKSIHIVSIYKKIINITSLDDVYNLVFEGVGHYSRLYVNHKFVSDHKCGFTRFSSDISKYLHLGDNEIALIVDSREINQPPFGFVIDYLCFGGIYREAYLLKLNKVHFKDSYFHHDKEKWYFDYKLSSDKNYQINLKITDKNSNIIIEKSVNNNCKLNGKMKKVKLWDVDNPYLYKLEAKIIDNDNVIDEISYDVAFRYAKFAKDGFYLNDKKLKILGANRHQSYPYVGYAMPKRAQYDDAYKIKELGFNAVRTSHYPQSPYFLKACDELGLLVFEEIPGWQHVGDEKWQEIAINNVKDMINRDKNHPSIILWGVRINESLDYHDFYVKTNEMAHKLDPYRQTGGVRYLMKSELLEDVYTYNDFVNSGKDLYLRRKEDVSSDMQKPYLITEYGGHMFPTKPYDNENRRSKLTLLHANVVKEARLHDEIAGTFTWCFADYNTHKDFGSGDLICYHGVCDIFRNEKYSAYTYKKFAKKPFLEVTSNFNIGESDGGYIRNFVISTNCDYVKMYHNGELIHIFNIKNFEIDGTFEVSDLIGNLLIDKHNLTNERSLLMKEIIQQLLLTDGVFRKETIDKYGIDDVNEAWGYYGKYVANWGAKTTHYTFKGYKNSKLVCNIMKGPQYLDHYKISVSNDKMFTNESYDVCKVTIQAIGNLNNKTDYSFDTFSIKTNDALKVIGDNNICLIGGARSFYVKSLIKEGVGNIIISSNNKVLISLDIDIINKSLTNCSLENKDYTIKIN